MTMSVNQAPGFLVLTIHDEDGAAALGPQLRWAQAYKYVLSVSVRP